MGNLARKIIAILLVLQLTVPAHAAQDETVSLNFVNADIQEVIRAISQLSNRNFLVDPRVKGTINIVSAKPVPASIAYDILLSALRLQGFAAVESAGITKIVPESDAKLHIDTLDPRQGGGDKLVTRVFVLQSQSASQLVSVVRPMVAPSNIVVAYPASNALVVTDYASSIKRIEKLVETLDRAENEAPTVIQVKHASAVDLANIINQMMPETSVPAGGDDNQRFVLLADSRTNSLLLRADNPNRISLVRELVATLDSKTATPGNIHVIPLKNSDAARLAETLRAVLETSSSSVPVTTNPANPVASAQANKTGSAARSISSQIQADTASNTIIVTAPDAVYNNLRAVVEQLDVRRPQVFVEALIVEVTADKAAEFGIQWQNLSGINSGTAKLIGGTNFGNTSNIIGASQNLSTVGQGLNIGVVKGTTDIPGVGTVLNLSALARALEADTNANILSAPNLMTLDNEEAKIVVGQNVPFITGQYAQTGSTTTPTPFQTIERKDVGLTLRIKPQIMQGGTVKLQVYQEVSSVVASAASTAGVITNKRSIESSVLVDQDQIVVLGGLIQDSVNNVQSKTPILGDIPILGGLFRYETRQHTKTNLMVFIRPFVMYQADAYRQLSERKYSEMSAKREVARMPDHWVLPNDDENKALPSLKVEQTLTTSDADEVTLKESDKVEEVDTTSEPDGSEVPKSSPAEQALVDKP